uniref:uncharacterized protein LOC131103352 isoform X4 n=1 Tax=Doryrhamphus excisus TaxID=161450 RepID=UPI0025ADC7A2|nr:uncharacterized protein LOC131103352 isoform X4 [Doryrhamphus excisus]
MLALMAAGGVFFPGLFLLSRLGLRVLMGWTEADATIVSVRHWLTEAYVSFAAPYFVYDVYAMFLCHRQRGGVQVATFVRREMLMVLHHAFMVLFCLPASLVTMATTLHSPANHRATVCVCVCAPGVEAGPRGLLPGRPVAGRAQHAVCESGQSSDAAGEGAHAAVQGQRRADAARLLRLPGGALPLLVPDLQQVRVRVRWAGGAGGAVAVQPGRRPAVAPAALLDGAHVQAGAPPPHGTLARQGQEDTVKGNLLFWSP